MRLSFFGVEGLQGTAGAKARDFWCASNAGLEGLLHPSFVASQLRALAAWNLRVKSLLLMRMPDAAEAGIRTTPTILGRASREREEEGKGKKQGDDEESG